MARAKKQSEAKRDPWLARAKAAFETSTSFIDTNYRKNWDDNIRHFKNKHAQSSKYLTETYKYRSKMFRPKTRAFVRQSEAATAAAFFSQVDTLTMEPYNELDPMNRAAAELRMEILNWRLTNTVPWFQICVGGMQDAQVIGVVASKQFWDFEEREETQPIVDPLTGQMAMDEEGNPVTQKTRIKLRDEPAIKLIPIENIRFDPAADWTDPVNSSPYVIGMEAMYICDVKKLMESGKWETLDDAVLKNARNTAYDSTRGVRNDNREDALDTRYAAPLSDYDIVWTHENILRYDGEDWHCYTLGTDHFLTRPKLLREAYLHNTRPYVIGSAVLETHTVIPDSPTHLAKGLQKEINEVANQRIDNVKLVLNKRYVVKRGKQVDLKSLVMNAPGSVTLANDPSTDVREMEFNDVTGSSYAEQDRLNVDFDDLLGSFSGGTIQSNRKLNETVGGLAMLRSGTNAMTQYIIRVFSETWVEPVLKQTDLLCQHYESDPEFLALMVQKSGIVEQYKLQNLTMDGIMEMLMLPCQLTVNVSNSATDPMIRLEQMLMAIAKYSEISANAPPDLDLEEIRKEVFSFLGYKNDRRFAKEQGQTDPRLMKAMAIIQKLQQALQGKQMDNQTKLEIARLQEEGETLRTGARIASDARTKGMQNDSNEAQFMLELASNLGRMNAEGNA